MAAVPLQPVTPTVDADDLQALQRLVEKFDRNQLIWSSGYLAGLAGSTAPAASVPAAEAATETWHVFYATETGNSRSIAEKLVQQASADGFTTKLHDLSSTRPKLLKSVQRAVFILATHGMGEAPEGSEAFFDYWFSDQAAPLNQLEYSVLALGDSSYADFCEMGRRFDERLLELGGTAIAARADCDLDFQASAENWVSSILEYVHETGTTVAAMPLPQLHAVPATSEYSKQRPFRAGVSRQQVITGRHSSKPVLHVELDLEGSGLSYQPGDSLGVLPDNPPQVIDAIAAATRLDADLLADREITALSRPILDEVATHHPQLQAILDDRKQFANYLSSRQLIDLAYEYPVDWEQPCFRNALRQLAPRSYSIASSLDANPGEAHLAVAVIDYEKFGRRHWGAASNFLASDAGHAQVFVESNEQFRLPDDPTTPIIMVGAGTGIAPYRAFIEHRSEHGHSGNNWLIFGNRNFASDFLYQLEWLRYRKAGVLTHLDVAFSRDQVEKIYVQQRLLEKGKDVFAWLESGAHLYVCGDATHMAVDVHSALLNIIAVSLGGSEDRAREYLQALKSSRRYQRDVY